MHSMVYHVPYAIRQYGNIKQFSCQGKGLCFCIHSPLHPDVGVEKHNDDSKRNYFSSNHWDAPGDIMMAEHMLELLQQYA